VRADGVIDHLPDGVEEGGGAEEGGIKVGDVGAVIFSFLIASRRNEPALHSKQIVTS
jgi:hypothetical protein